MSVFSKLDSPSWLIPLCFSCAGSRRRYFVHPVPKPGTTSPNPESACAHGRDRKPTGMFPRLPPPDAADCLGCARKLSTSTGSPSSPSPRSRWRSRRVSKNSKRLQQTCTRRYKLDETEVCRNPDVGSHTTFFSQNIASRHGRWNGATLRVQDVQFPVLQANLRLSVYHVHRSGILVSSLRQRWELMPFLRDFSRRCSLVILKV